MDMTPRALTREPRYIKRYYCPTELLRGESQGGRTERELIDLSDAVYLEKENAAIRQALTQQAQEVEAIRNTLGCHRAYIIESINDLKAKTDDIPNIDRMRQAEQEVERLKAALVRMEADRDDARTERNTAVIGNNILRDKLATMTVERDNFKTALFKQYDREKELETQLAASQARVRELDSTQCTSPWEDSPPCRGIQRQLDRIATLQATLAAREAKISELEKMNGNLGNDRVQFLLKSVGLEADLDTARQDAARLREALGQARIVLHGEFCPDEVQHHRSCLEAQRALKGA